MSSGKLPPACRDGAQWELACHKCLAVPEVAAGGFRVPSLWPGHDVGSEGSPGKGARARPVLLTNMNHPFLAEPEWLDLVDVTFPPLAL